jgi:hypothetical protein
MKRILWKVFAKRGELIARHPERSVSPEGHLLGFVLARRSDDGLAAWATAYLSAAEAQGITVSCGCLGMRTETPWANSARALEDSLIEYAFKTEPVISTEVIHQVLGILRSRIGHPHEGGTTLGIFIDAGALESSEIANSLISLRTNLLAEGVSCEMLLKKSGHYSSSRSNRISFWEKVFLEKARKTKEGSHPEDNDRAEIVRQFINHAALKGMTLHQEQTLNQGMRPR